MLWPGADVHPVGGIAGNVGHIDRRDVGVPQPGLVAELQERWVHIARGRDQNGSEPINWDQEAIIVSELRRERGAVVDASGAFCKFPQALRQAEGDHVRPIGIKYTTRLAWFGQACKLALAEMAERFVVDEELCGHGAPQLSGDGRTSARARMRVS